MNKLVWLLIILNIGLLAYFNQELFLPNVPEEKVVEIEPEKIVILTQKDIDTLPKKVFNTSALAPSLSSNSAPAPTGVVETPKDPAKNMCYEWGIFSTNNLAKVRSALTQLSLHAIVKKQNATEAKRFWVYKPPLKSSELAQAKATELKDLGIEELYIVPDGKWKNAISFGVFEDEQLANKLLQELKAKGVKEINKGLREGAGYTSLQLNQLTQAQLKSLKKLKADFPEAEIKEVACP